MPLTIRPASPADYGLRFRRGRDVAMLSGTGGVVVAYLVALLGTGLGFLATPRHMRALWVAPVLAAPLAVLALLVASLVGAALHAGAVVRGLVSVCALLGIGWAGARAIAARWAALEGHVRRGARVGAPPPRDPEAAPSLTLAGVPVAPGDEVRHFKCIGTTGTGKSTAIRELLDGALARGDRAVIADPDGAALARHYDPARGDLILNPFDARAARWDPFLELRAAHDPEQLARALVGEGRGSEQAWRAYAQALLADLLRRLSPIGDDRLAELVRLLAAAEPGELRVLLEGAPSAALVAEGNERMLASVRAVATTTTAMLSRLLEQPARPVSVRDWVERGSGVLFLPYRADEIAALRQLVSTWLRTAIFQAMSQGERDHRLWFVVDELDALGAIDGLGDALARLRKYGGRVVLGFQSIAQVSGTYGDAASRTIVENCASTLLLRCSASEGGGTARFAAELVGQREVLRLQRGYAEDGPWRPGRHRASLTEQLVVEPALLASEIERLADLEGFLKLASRPDWMRVRLARPGGRGA